MISVALSMVCLDSAVAFKNCISVLALLCLIFANLVTFILMLITSVTVKLHLFLTDSYAFIMRTCSHTS